MNPLTNSTYRKSSYLVPLLCILGIERETKDLSLRVPTINVLNYCRNNGFVAEIFVAYMTQDTDFPDARHLNRWGGNHWTAMN
ncbi:MAG TPA: hypothetical protein VN957_31030 [Chthoniobacterales bacterium]|nr:hypothetical protein [Chthoniobacterales bacterium]